MRKILALATILLFVDPTLSPCNGATSASESDVHLKQPKKEQGSSDLIAKSMFKLLFVSLIAIIVLDLFRTERNGMGSSEDNGGMHRVDSRWRKLRYSNDGNSYHQQRVRSSLFNNNNSSFDMPSTNSIVPSSATLGKWMDLAMGSVKEGFNDMISKVSSWID